MVGRSNYRQRRRQWFFDLANSLTKQYADICIEDLNLDESTKATVIRNGEKQANFQIKKNDSTKIGGNGVKVERYPGYEYTSLCYNFKGREMEPMVSIFDWAAVPAPVQLPWWPRLPAIWAFSPWVS